MNVRRYSTLRASRTAMISLRLRSMNFQMEGKRMYILVAVSTQVCTAGACVDFDRCGDRVKSILHIRKGLFATTRQRREMHVTGGFNQLRPAGGCLRDALNCNYCGTIDRILTLIETIGKFPRATRVYED